MDDITGLNRAMDNLDTRTFDAPGSIAELGRRLDPTFGFHIRDWTIYGLFQKPKRTVEVVRTDGRRTLLGVLTEVETRSGLRVTSFGDDPLTELARLPEMVITFSPEGTAPYRYLQRALDWFRARGVRIEEPGAG